MSDSGKKDIALRAGVEGVDDVGKAADKALSPWESGAKKVGGALKSAFVGAFQDAGRLLTVANAISLDRAFESARKYRAEIGQLSATAGPIGQLRAQIGAISQQKLIRESEIVAADRGLGRIVYSTKNALGALGALGDEAHATGETLSDKLPLGAALMNGLGVAGEKVGDELGRVRALSDNLGTSGGLLAAEDRLTSMSGLLSEIGAKTDADRAKFEAMALGLGKGLGAGAGSRASQAILGALSGHREQFAALAGMKVSALTDENGNLKVDAAMTAAERTQAWIRRQSKDRGMQQMIATSLVGGDRQAGAALLNADFAAMRRAAAETKPSGKTAAEADAYRKSEAGQAEARTQEAERVARATAEGLLPFADKMQSIMAAHPISGGMLGNMGLNLAGQGLGGVLGGMGKALLGGGEAVARGGAAAGQAVAAGGAAAGASLRAGAMGGVGGKAGNPLGKAGLVGLAGVVGYEAGTWLDEQTGLSDSFAGTSAAHRDLARLQDNEHTSKAVASQREQRQADRRDRAGKIVAHYNRNREKFSQLYQGGDEENASGDVGLQRLAGGLAKGAVDTTGLSAGTVQIIKDAIEAAHLTVKIENHSESPIAANDAQRAGGLKN